MQPLSRTSVARISARLASLAGLAAIFVACGGGGGGSVINPPPTQKLGSITAQGTINLSAGNTATIAATALDESGSVITGVSSFSYSSNATAIAEVSANGTVLGVTAGAATITVSLTLNGVTKTTTVAVTVTGVLQLSANVAAGTASTDFQPPLVGIGRGGTVTFSFGQLAHNVTFEATNGAPGNIPNSTSTSVARTFNTAGDFAYQCTLHGGMSGKVIVR